MTDIEYYIHSTFGLEKALAEKVSNLFQKVNLSKRSYFSKGGSYCEKMGFVHQGILREFAEFGDKEVTRWVATKGHLVMDKQSFFMQMKGKWNIQAYTDCEIFVIRRSDYDRIGEIVPKWYQFEKAFVTKQLGEMEDRISEQIALSAEQRYFKLFMKDRNLFNEVPSKYLASVLGMTPETFSRIRNKQLRQ
jgi:CRP/FNR family transcriptional regulator, anaerobic regulatory protein